MFALSSLQSVSVSEQRLSSNDHLTYHIVDPMAPLFLPVTPVQNPFSSTLRATFFFTFPGHTSSFFPFAVAIRRDPADLRFAWSIQSSSRSVVTFHRRKRFRKELLIVFFAPLNPQSMPRLTWKMRKNCLDPNVASAPDEAMNQWISGSGRQISLLSLFFPFFACCFRPAVPLCTCLCEQHTSTEWRKLVGEWKGCNEWLVSACYRRSGKVTKTWDEAMGSKFSFSWRPFFLMSAGDLKACALHFDKIYVQLDCLLVQSCSDHWVWEERVKGEWVKESDADATERQLN